MNKAGNSQHIYVAYFKAVGNLCCFVELSMYEPSALDVPHVFVIMHEIDYI